MNNDFSHIAGVVARKEPNPLTGQPCSCVLIAPHTTPDGDALGSALAFAHLASGFGASVFIYLPEAMPESFAWLACPWPVVTCLAQLEGVVPDLVAVLDCGDARRPGPELAAFLEGKMLPSPEWANALTISIDHHLGNPAFARYNWVDSTKAATGEMIGLLAEFLQVPLSGSLGEAIYLALVADTGKFTFPNTTSSTLAMASRILENGLDIARFTTLHENIWSLGRMRLWGELMHSITLHHNGLVASCIAWQHQLDRHNATKDDLEGFAAQVKRIKGVEAAIFIRQNGANGSKMSFRSIAQRDVRLVAASFGGGGHKNAAGVEVDMPPDKALELAVQRILGTWRTGAAKQAAK